MYSCAKIISYVILILSLVVQLELPARAEVVSPSYSTVDIVTSTTFVEFPQIAFIHSSARPRLNAIEHHTEPRVEPGIKSQLPSGETIPQEKAHTGVDIEGVEVKNKEGQTRFKVDRFHVSVETLRDAIQNPAKLVALDMTMNSAKGLYDSFNSYKEMKEKEGHPIAPCQIVRIRREDSKEIHYIYEGDSCSESLQEG